MGKPEYSSSGFSSSTNVLKLFPLNPMATTPIAGLTDLLDMDATAFDVEFVVAIILLDSVDSIDNCQVPEYP